MLTAAEKTFFYKSRPITAAVQKTDNGMQILIVGGDRSHIGAVSVCDPDGNVNTICYPGHRDDAISQNWAAAFWKAFHIPVTVSAGIHYDHITAEEITELLKETDHLKEEILNEQQFDLST